MTYTITIFCFFRTSCICYFINFSIFNCFINIYFNFTISNLYPDIRRIVNILRKCSYDGKLEVDEESVTTNEKKVIASVTEIISYIEKNQESKIGRCVNAIIEILVVEEIEYRGVYTELFFHKKIPVPANVIINKY